MKHIVSFSGGKDSTAMLLMMLEKGMQVDEIRFFDCGSWEFNEMHKHIDAVEKHIGIPITRLKPDMDFDYLLGDKKITKGPRKGQFGYGFPFRLSRWCTGRKLSVVGRGITSEDINYIGIAKDEENRIQNKQYRNIQARFPLVEWGVTEKDALRYCYEKGFNWGGLYEYFDRVSCWCCPLQPLKSLRKLYKNFPQLWCRLAEMEKKSWRQFRADYSVKDLEEKFERENNQDTLFQVGTRG